MSQLRELSMLGFKYCRSEQDIITPHFSFQGGQYHKLSALDREEIFGLRYQSYCVECGYLDPTLYVYELEQDEFDARSSFAVARNQHRDIVGTARLVEATHEEQSFPWQSHCEVFPGTALPDPLQSAEVSRLVVDKKYRRRRNDSLSGVAKDMKEGEVRRGIPLAPSFLPQRKVGRTPTPQILLGMYRELYRYSRANGIRYWYAAMERHLANSMQKMGFRFRAIGPEVDYYGPVTLYMADLDEVVQTLDCANPLLSAWFHDKDINCWMMLRESIARARPPAASCEILPVGRSGSTLDDRAG